MERQCGGMRLLLESNERIARSEGSRMNRSERRGNVAKSPKRLLSMAVVGGKRDGKMTENG